MKRLNLFLSAVLLLLGTAVGAVQKDTLRILAIGNSFSQDAVEQNLHEIAKADGQELIIGNMYIGGCSLERHYGIRVKSMNLVVLSPDYPTYYAVPVPKMDQIVQQIVTICQQRDLGHRLL